MFRRREGWATGDRNTIDIAIDIEVQQASLLVKLQRAGRGLDVTRNWIFQFSDKSRLLMVRAAQPRTAFSEGLRVCPQKPFRRRWQGTYELNGGGRGTWTG